MSTSETTKRVPNTPAPKRAKSKKVALAALAAIVVVAGGAAVWYARTRPTVNPAESVVVQASRSGDFAAVGKALDSGQVKLADVRDAVRQEFEHQTIERVNNYFATNDPRALQQILDRAIDDMEKFRAESRRRAAAAAAANGGAAAATQPSTRPLSEDPRVKMVAWALNQPADTRAKLAEFRVAIEKRRAERHLPGMFEGNASFPLGGGGSGSR